MMRRIERTAKLGDAACHSGRGLVVHDHHRFYRVAAIGSQPRFQFRGVRASPPGAGHVIDLNAEFLGDPSP